MPSTPIPTPSPIITILVKMVQLIQIMIIFRANSNKYIKQPIIKVVIIIIIVMFNL